MSRKASYSIFWGLSSLSSKIKGPERFFLNNNNNSNCNRVPEYFFQIKLEEYVCDRETCKSVRHGIDTLIMNALLNYRRPEFQPLPPTEILP